MDQFCGHCGEAATVGDHTGCQVRLRLEPPRYCVRCRRRMSVQVTPGAWVARCVEHGEVSTSTWD